MDAIRFTLLLFENKFNSLRPLTFTQRAMIEQLIDNIRLEDGKLRLYHDSQRAHDENLVAESNTVVSGESSQSTFQSIYVFV